MPTITLPDGSQREFSTAVTVADVAADIGERNDLAREQPDRVRTMTQRYEEWRQRVGAR